MNPAAIREVIVREAHQRRRVVRMNGGAWWSYGIVPVVRHRGAAARRVESYMRSPIAYYGGKGFIADKLIRYFPPHLFYCEPFCGSAAMLFAKRPAEIETINDINSDVVNFFRVLRDPEKAGRLRELLDLTPYSREEWRECRATCRNGDLDDVERARRWFTQSRQSFSNQEIRGGWGYAVGERSSRRHMASTVSKWRSGVDGIKAAADRLRRVQIENDDALNVLCRFDVPDVLHYVDPPYVLETRVHAGYRHELTNDDHEALIDTLLSLCGMVVLSGYAHPIYERLECHGWEREEIPTVCFAAGRTRGNGRTGPGVLEARTECVWSNPAAIRRRGMSLWAGEEPEEMEAL